MKESTGEVSMTVVTIVILALLIGIGTWLFGNANSPARKWIDDLFNRQTGEYDTGSTEGPSNNLGPTKEQ